MNYIRNLRIFGTIYLWIFVAKGNDYKRFLNLKLNLKKLLIDKYAIQYENKNNVFKLDIKQRYVSENQFLIMVHVYEQFIFIFTKRKTHSHLIEK